MPAISDLEARYVEGRTAEDLLLVLSDGLVFSAAGLVQALRLPRRGRWILDLERRFRPKSYAKFLELDHTAWSTCILLAARHLRRFLRDQIPAGDVVPVCEYAAAWAVSAVNMYTKTSAAESKHLEAVFLRLFSESGIPSDGPHDLAILSATLGLRLAVDQIGAYARELLEDPIAIAKPWIFAECWHELGASADQLEISGHGGG